MTAAKLPVALFSHVEDNKPQQRAWTWERLRALLTEHEERATKNGQLWSPTAYKEGSTRKRENVEAVSLLVMDFDSGIAPGPFKTLWDEYEWVIHSSFSHSPDHPKWRGVLPLAEPVPAADWPRVYAKLAAALGQGHADPACKDASRIYYAPSCPPGAPRFAEAHAGRWLDPNDFPDPEPERPRASAPRRPAQFPQGSGDYATLDVVRWFQAHGLYGGPGSKPGQHYVACPWESEHTEQKSRPEQDSDTAIYEGDGDRLWPQFNCLHGHCIDRKIEDVLDRLGDADRYCSREFEVEPSRKFTLSRPEATTEGRDRLADALRLLMEEVLPQVKDDPGAVFASPAKTAVAFLKQYDPENWARVKRELVRARVSMRDLNAALPRVRLTGDERKQLVGDDGLEDDPQIAGDLLPECPCPTLIIPHPYSVSETHTTRLVADEDSGHPIPQTVAFAPVLITGMTRDITTGEESLVLAWKHPRSSWQRRAEPRYNVLTARNLGQLAKVGFPVGDDNAKPLTSYLHRLEAANRPTMPCAKVSGHLGWQGDPHEATPFLCGRMLILPDGTLEETVSFELDRPETWREDRIAFQSASAADEQIVDGFHKRGSLEEWLRIVSKIAPYPKALIPFYAGFCTPFLELWKIHNFIIDMHNKSTTGKSTVTHVVGSIWGNPDERTVDACVYTWNVSQVWAERASAVMAGMPLFLDDTKMARDKKDVGRMIYHVTSGRGRGRGTIGGLAKMSVWRTILFSNGEESCVNFTQEGGTRQRVIQLKGPPLGEQGPRAQRLTEQLNAGVAVNYGHAGPLFLQWVMRNREQWPVWKAKLDEWHAYYSAKAPSPEGGRLASYAALITVIGELTHQALSLPWEWTNPVDELWVEIASHAMDAAGEARALADVVAWAHSHEGQFIGRERSDGLGGQRPIHGEIAGRWDCGKWDFIGFFPPVLRRVLTDYGFSPDAIFAGWSQKQWLDHEPGKYTRTQRIGDDKRTRLICITRTAIEAVENET